MTTTSGAVCPNRISMLEMIMMWFGFWLFHALGGDKDVWWNFPFFITFLVLVLAEIFSYVVIGAECEARFKKQSS